MRGLRPALFLCPKESRNCHDGGILIRAENGYHITMKDETDYRSKLNKELDEKALIDLIYLLQFYDDRREYVD